MKILIATNAGGLEDNVSPVFGRSPTYTIVEVEGKEIKNVRVIPNQFASAIHGAGVQAGQLAVSEGAKVAIAGNFGPNVANILRSAGIEMVIFNGKVREAIENHIKRGDEGTDIAMLEEEISRIEEMLQEIKNRLNELEKK
ncbi:MAG: dinitrogenase iron-molybdenum cofactor [Thermoplasmatales archaeon]|nr:dinitrogenase iron-molybdenum cofactor [Thermoplasmatales archaeon]